MTKKTWLVAFIFGLPWAILMIIYFSIIKGGVTPEIIISTLIGGVVVGLLFAWVMQYTAKRLFKKVTIETGDNETIIKEGGANHFKGKEGFGGKLVLTDKRLIFKSHRFNIQNHQDDFELGHIERLHINKKFNFLENGLTLELTNNESHKFIVDEPKEWVEVIMNQQRGRGSS